MQEVQALIELSNALSALVKSEVMKVVKAEIIKRTVFAALFAALSPGVWIKIAQLASQYLILTINLHVSLVYSTDGSTYRQPMGARQISGRQGGESPRHAIGSKGAGEPPDHAGWVFLRLISHL